MSGDRGNRGDNRGDGREEVPDAGEPRMKVYVRPRYVGVTGRMGSHDYAYAALYWPGDVPVNPRRGG